MSSSESGSTDPRSVAQESEEEFSLDDLRIDSPVEQVDDFFDHLQSQALIQSKCKIDDATVKQAELEEWQEEAEEPKPEPGSMNELLLRIKELPPLFEFQEVEETTAQPAEDKEKSPVRRCRQPYRAAEDYRITVYTKKKRKQFNKQDLINALSGFLTVAGNFRQRCSHLKTKIDRTS